MNHFQIIAMSEIALFYIAYFTKMGVQRKKGIQTNQLGKGAKSQRTLIVEKILRVASFLILPIELISMGLNTNWYGNEIIRYVGLVLALLGVISFVVAMLTMRDSWRAGIPETDKTDIVTNGIYKISRNPAFLGFDLTYVGFLFVFDNPLLWMASLFVIIAMHLQIREEEKFMEMTFGETYREYKRKVGRYFLFI